MMNTGEQFDWLSDIGQQLIEEAHTAALVERDYRVWLNSPFGRVHQEAARLAAEREQREAALTLRHFSRRPDLAARCDWQRRLKLGWFDAEMARDGDVQRGVSNLQLSPAAWQHLNELAEDGTVAQANRRQLA